MNLDRRTLFQIVAAAGAALQLAGEPSTPKFFTSEEFDLLDKACELILPADDEGGGAHEAGVARYIDIVVAHSDPQVQAFWKQSLGVLQSAPDLMAMLNELAAAETGPDPKSDLGRFFLRLKALTVEAFFQSEVGFRYVRYQGNRASYDFPGCTHPEHKKA